MFGPYVMLCSFLNKQTIVISDNDKSINDGVNPSSRFIKLRELCKTKLIKLIEVDNTLETDLYNHNFIAKRNKKTEIALKLIELDVDLSNWHVISEVISEFKNH